MFSIKNFYSLFSLIDISPVQERVETNSRREGEGNKQKKKKNGTKCRLIINNVLNQKYNVAKS